MYLIYGQIFDLLSEIYVNLKTKASDVRLIYNRVFLVSTETITVYSIIASEGSDNPKHVIGCFGGTSYHSYQPFHPSTVISDIWSYRIFDQFMLAPTSDCISDINCTKKRMRSSSRFRQVRCSEMERSAERLVRGCENFVPALV